MRTAIALLFISPLLTGCFGPSAEEVDAQQHDQCVNFGLSRGTPEYADCRIRLAQEQRQLSFQRQQALAAGIANVGSDMKPVQVQMPTTQQQQRQPVRCQSRRNALGVETNCE